jgi:hypothetical protein
MSVWNAIKSRKLDLFVSSVLNNNDANINSNEIKRLKDMISKEKNYITEYGLGEINHNNAHENLNKLKDFKGYFEDIKKSAISLNQKVPGTFSEEEIAELDASLKKIEVLARRPIRNEGIAKALEQGNLADHVTDLINARYDDRRAELIDIRKEILIQWKLNLDKMKNVDQETNKVEKLKIINTLLARQKDIDNARSILGNEIEGNTFE